MALKGTFGLPIPVVGPYAQSAYQPNVLIGGDDAFDSDDASGEKMALSVKASLLTSMALSGGAIAAALLQPVAPAFADVPTPGADCAAAQIGESAGTSGGSPLRCMADDQGKIHWLPDTNAVATIAGLQAAGYSVTVDRSGDRSIVDCRVVEVHNPMTVTSMNSGGTAPGGPGSRGAKHQVTIVVDKTIDVTLDCTGG